MQNKIEIFLYFVNIMQAKNPIYIYNYLIYIIFL